MPKDKAATPPGLGDGFGSRSRGSASMRNPGLKLSNRLNFYANHSLVCAVRYDLHASALSPIVFFA